MTSSDFSRQSHALFGRTPPPPFGKVGALFFGSTSPAAQSYAARVARGCGSDCQQRLVGADVTASVQQALKQGDA